MSQARETRRQRQHLHFDALVRQVRRRFEKIPDMRKGPGFSLADTLMAGLALYSLKDPSLLAFQRRARDPTLRSVFGLEAIPSDSRTSARTATRRTTANATRPAASSIASAKTTLI